MSERRRIQLDEHGDPIPEALPPEPVQCRCPRLDRDDWDGVESDWSDITFLKGSVAAVGGVPVGYRSAWEELEKRAEATGASVPEDAMVLLGEGKFRRPLLLEVENVPDDLKQVERPGGAAYTRLLEAPPGSVGKVVSQVMAEAKERFGTKPDDLWIWYLTCRLCSGERKYETLFVAHRR